MLYHVNSRNTKLCGKLLNITGLTWSECISYLQCILYKRVTVTIDKDSKLKLKTKAKITFSKLRSLSQIRAFTCMQVRSRMYASNKVKLERWWRRGAVVPRKKHLVRLYELMTNSQAVIGKRT